MPVVHHYPACGTCRKALAWLDAEGHTHTRVDIVATPPAAPVLAAAIRSSGLPLTRFFNTAGESYRAGDWKSRVGALTVASAADALAADGKLIKRPLVLFEDGRVLVGFDAAAWAAAFAGSPR